jgi:hypothetical protein
MITSRLLKYLIICLVGIFTGCKSSKDINLSFIDYNVTLRPPTSFLSDFLHLSLRQKNYVKKLSKSFRVVFSH